MVRLPNVRDLKTRVGCAVLGEVLRYRIGFRRDVPPSFDGVGSLADQARMAACLDLAP